jgi:hypothetical protein
MSRPVVRDGGPVPLPSRALDRTPSTVVRAVEPLLTYKEALNPRSDFDQLERLLGDQLNAGEAASLKDFKLYIVKGEASWVLDQEATKFPLLFILYGTGIYILQIEHKQNLLMSNILAILMLILLSVKHDEI